MSYFDVTEYRPWDSRGKDRNGFTGRVHDIAQARWKEMKPLPEKSPNAAPPSPVIVKGKIILVADTGKVWELDPMTMAYRDLARLPEATSVDKFVWLSDGIIGAGGENNLEGPRRRSDTTFIGRFGAK